MTINIRNVNENDAEILQKLAAECGILDIHTIYTYWVICNYFSKHSYIMQDGDRPIGFITYIENDKCALIWQIGIIKKYRGKGLSKLLIGAVISGIENKDIHVTIDEHNTSSNRAFKKYADENNYTMYSIGKVELSGIDTSENEVVYNLKRGNQK